jgi:radical SAM superfamily enzyme YgiQ (UPF0313 family)
MMFRAGDRFVFNRPGMAVVVNPINLRRPPNEANSLILQATIGCPWNRCGFCGNYKRKQFLPRYSEVIEDISIAKHVFGEQPTHIFLADANSLVLKTDQLLDIAQTCYEVFPNLEQISSYGSTRFIIRKGQQELTQLHESGIKKIYLGLETGDDELLRSMNKGATAEEMMNAAKTIANAGIMLSVTVIQGLGGKGSWRRSAELTANVLNTMKPCETRFHNLIIHPDSFLAEQVKNSEFHPATREEILMEMRELIRQLTIDTRIFTYSTNYLHPGLLDGHLPKDRRYMLRLLDAVLTSPNRNQYLQPSRMI